MNPTAAPAAKPKVKAVAKNAKRADRNAQVTFLETPPAREPLYTGKVEVQQAAAKIDELVATKLAAEKIQPMRRSPMRSLCAAFIWMWLAAFPPRRKPWRSWNQRMPPNGRSSLINC
ncbi:hypothetical protein [Verrucomicrobium spinosum]|uniref:hypothetical protein n=1 Tax=Verrucomicrobium spinosum TaxID=2736 RepID=UPI000A736DD8|nr:hypothetical protein [Verrucomicrobium spinosum]